MKNKKPIIITSIVILLLLVVVGGAYAFFSYESGTKSDIVTGQIYMNYEETSAISLTGMFPETKEQALARQDENGVFEFTITGRNTSKYPVYYEIDLLDGGVVTSKTENSTKILPEHVMIYLEKDGVPVIEGQTYKDFNSRRIYVETVPANQEINIEHKYVLRMWINENVTISDTAPNADYTTTEWNDSYASLKVRVVGDFEEKEMYLTAAETVINKVGTEGIVAVATDGGRYTDVQTQTIREYRYTASSANNYVWFNNELWLMLGVFPMVNSSGITENLVKIVKAAALTAEEIPTTYTYNGVEMTLKANDIDSSAYWNKEKYFGQNNLNDWTQAALQYYLNDGTEGSASYYNRIDPVYRNMIESVTYNLSGRNLLDVPSVVYTEENSGNAYSGNQAKWIGKIGLLYPSDFGYMRDIGGWSRKVSESIVYSGGWINGTFSDTTWLITVSTRSGTSGTVISSGNRVSSTPSVSLANEVQPVLYLKSDVMITGGTGLQYDAYNLKYNG